MRRKPKTIKQFPTLITKKYLKDEGKIWLDSIHAPAVGGYFCMHCRKSVSEVKQFEHGWGSSVIFPDSCREKKHTYITLDKDTEAEQLHMLVPATF